MSCGSSSQVPSSLASDTSSPVLIPREPREIAITAALWQTVRESASRMMVGLGELEASEELIVRRVTPDLAEDPDNWPCLITQLDDLELVDRVEEGLSEVYTSLSTRLAETDLSQMAIVCIAADQEEVAVRGFIGHLDGLREIDTRLEAADR